jgi:hypothetical protein
MKRLSWNVIWRFIVASIGAIALVSGILLILDTAVLEPLRRAAKIVLSLPTKDMRVSGTFVARNVEGEIIDTFDVKLENGAYLKIDVHPTDAYRIELEKDSANALSCQLKKAGAFVTAKRCTFLGAYVREGNERVPNPKAIETKKRIIVNGPYDQVSTTMFFLMEFEEEGIEPTTASPNRKEEQ